MRLSPWHVGCGVATVAALAFPGAASGQSAPAGGSSSPPPPSATAVPSPAGAEGTSPLVSGEPAGGAASPGEASASKKELPSAPGASAWGAAYAEARALLLQGHFAEARTKLLELSHSAPGPIDRELALELGNLAGAWRARKVSLVEVSEIADSATVARRENRRTTDEIAVLYLNGAIYGLGSGAAIAVHTDPRSPAGAILPALALGGAGVGLVAALDSGRGLGYGVPQSIVSGMYLGLAEGILWSTWNQARAHYFEEWQPTTVADVIWAGATLGAVGGGVLSTVYGATPGRASYVGTTALWSSAVIGLFAGAVSSDDSRLDDHALLAASLGLNVGVVAGVLTARSVSPSIARVRFLDLGALAGGVVLGGLSLSAAGRQVDDPRPALALTALGIGAGFGIAWWLTRDMPSDRLAEERRASSPWTRLALAPTRGGGQVTVVGGF